MSNIYKVKEQYRYFFALSITSNRIFIFCQQFTGITGVSMDYFGDFASKGLFTQQVRHGNQQVAFLLALVRTIDDLLRDKEKLCERLKPPAVA